MSKSKKFKPVLKISEIRCGETYLRVVVNDEGWVYLCTYKTTSDPYIKPCEWQKTGKALKVDYWNQDVGKSGPYHFKDNFVSDMVGIYEGRRQAKSFHDHSGYTSFSLHPKGLFKFSNKLLEKLKSFNGDPIKVYEFLNPEKLLTPSQQAVILFDLQLNKYKNAQNDTLEKFYFKKH